MSLRTIKKRRRECKTDYKARLSLLKSNLDRIVIRRTSKYIIIQQIKSKGSLDGVVVSTNSKELLKYGWNEKNGGSLKSISAAYLSGRIMAKKIKEGKFIIDLGLLKNHSGGRVYAVVKGLIDGGLEIPANEKVFPSEERINGEHLKEDVKKMIVKVKEKIENEK